MTTRGPEAVPGQVQVTGRGDVPAEMREYAATKIGRVARYAHQPVLEVSVVLTLAEDPARERPATAEASLDVNGTQVRAKMSAPQMGEAIDLLEDRLRRNLVQHEDRIRTRHRWIGLPDEHEWRRGDLPTPRGGETFPRPPEERQVIRRKTFALAPITVDEAAYEMDLLGHDFYLFIEVVSGADAVVRRDEEGGYVVHGEVLAQPHPSGKVTYDGPAAVLTDEEARTRLEVGGEPFVFYVEPASRRGRVLYLRYDGHYGLITPAEE